MKSLVAFGRPSRQRTDSWTKVENPYLHENIESADQIRKMCSDQIAKVSDLLHQQLEAFEKKVESSSENGFTLIASSWGNIEYEVNKLALQFFSITDDTLTIRRTATHAAFGLTSYFINDFLIRFWGNRNKDHEINLLCSYVKKAFGVEKEL